MDQASALPAASCERNPAAPRTSSSCSRSEDRSQTGALPPARLVPQSVPHVAPSSRDPRPSSPALCSTQRDICCRIFTPAQPEYPAASVRDNCSGAYILLARNVGYSLLEGWIVWSIALYILTGVFWLPVVWMQMRMRDLASEAARMRQPLPVRYHELFWLWFAFGFPAF